jgi:hypothetical protein
MVEGVGVCRGQLQQGADGHSPRTDAANAGLQKKFDLPANRPLHV